MDKCKSVIFYQNNDKFVCKLTLFNNDSKLHTTHSSIARQTDTHTHTHIIYSIINWCTQIDNILFTLSSNMNKDRDVNGWDRKAEWVRACWMYCMPWIRELMLLSVVVIFASSNRTIFFRWFYISYSLNLTTCTMYIKSFLHFFFIIFIDHPFSLSHPHFFFILSANILLKSKFVYFCKCA